MTEDEMAGWHHPLNRHEFEQTPGDSEGQGNLVCYSPWGPQRTGHNLVTEQQQIICDGTWESKISGGLYRGSF